MAVVRPPATTPETLSSSSVPEELVSRRIRVCVCVYKEDLLCFTVPSPTKKGLEGWRWPWERDALPGESPGPYVVSEPETGWAWWGPSAGSVSPVQKLTGF